MKMTRYKFTGLILLLVFLAASCDLSGTAEDLEENEGENPVSVFPPELWRLNIFFNKKKLAVGESFIVRGNVTRDVYTPGLEEPLELILSTDADEQVTVSGFQWWDFFPPEDLEEVFRNHASLALIGGKEVDEDRGYAPCAEGGGRIVSAETIEMLAEWVKQKEGIENAYRVPSRYVINVYLKQEEITAEEIREIRDHPNFWFMEPAEGLFLKAMNQLNTADEENCSESIRQVFRLFRWEELEELLTLEPGMVLTISYEQPDGSLLETSVNIVE